MVLCWDEAGWFAMTTLAWVSLLPCLSHLVQKSSSLWQDGDTVGQPYSLSWENTIRTVLLPSCCQADILSLFYTIKLSSVHFSEQWAYAILLIKPGLVFFCTRSQTRITCILNINFKFYQSFQTQHNLLTPFAKCYLAETWEKENKSRFISFIKQTDLWCERWYSRFELWRPGEMYQVV